MVTLNREGRDVAAFLEALNAWIGAEVRVWYFSCGHNRFVLRLARGDAGHREFKFFWFLDCDTITVRYLEYLTNVEITNLPGERWRLDATGISVECYACGLAEPRAEVLRDMSGLTHWIMLE